VHVNDDGFPVNCCRIGCGIRHGFILNLFSLIRGATITSHEHKDQARREREHLAHREPNSWKVMRFGILI
jgi:hypothetical protein